MKKFFEGLVIILLFVGMLFLERSEQVWPLEQSVIKLLARATHHPLPTVTAVKMPLTQSQLLPQDVALVLRAIVSFHPREILILEPAADFSSGPFLLLREAIEKGEIQGVPIYFVSHETYSEKNNKSITNVSLISLDDLLLRREERERGSIFPELDVLFSGQTVLLGGPQIAEQAKAFLNQAEKKIVKVPSLGLARIFHRSLLRKPGTPMAAALDLNFDQDSMDSYSPDKNSASALPYHPLRLSRRESDEISWLELTFLLVILLLLTKIQALSWIDFLLVLLGVACCCIALDAWMLHARGNIFPLIVPCGLLVIAIFRKVFYCTKKMK